MSAAIWNDLAERARVLFDVELSLEELGKLRTLVHLVETWSRTVNLLSARSTAEIVHRHVLDSLAPTVFLGKGSAFVDVGAGGGFPGIPLAVALGGAADLIESRRRRVTFLRHAVRTLGLSAVTVFSGRAEDFSGEEVPNVVGRGVRPEEIALFGARALRTGGKLVLMTKADQKVAIGDPFEYRSRTAYELPGGLRHAVVLFEKSFT